MVSQRLPFNQQQQPHQSINNNNLQQQQQSSSSTNDSFVSSLIQELKTIKLSNNHITTNINNSNQINSSIDGVMPMLGESSITINKQNNSNWTTTKTTSLWDAAPHSPTYSMNTHYHSSSSHSNSKESLWASTQSSPNSAHREQLQHQHSSSSTSSTPSSLWENPSSKLSQASLMSKNDSLSSIWQTPPQTQSPDNIGNKISNLWDSPNSFGSANGGGGGGGMMTGSGGSLFGNSNSYQNLHNSGHSLIRPQDLSSADIWGNNNSGMALKPNKDPVGSLWAQPTPATTQSAIVPTFNKNHTMITSTPMKSHQMHPIKPDQRNAFNNLPHVTANAKNNLSPAITNTSAPASSSCLQLFSDEFINYLNMIN